MADASSQNIGKRNRAKFQAGGLQFSSNAEVNLPANLSLSRGSFIITGKILPVHLPEGGSEISKG